MATAASSPAVPRVPDIVRRDLRFDLESADLRAWHPEGLHVAHFFNTLSIFFPEGEAFFIDSVRRHAERVRSPKLRAEVEGFLGQEAMHSREHRRYNRALAAAGLPAEALEKTVIAVLDVVRKYTSPAEHLAATVALEHFTAMMADLALRDEASLAGADPRLSAVWRWHAMEETEHKAVAFDVYREVLGEGALAYGRRAGAMLLASILFWTLYFRFHLRLVRSDRATGDASGWWRYFRFLWISPGVIRKLVLPWFSYFRPGFHPWQHDNSGLVASWRALYAATGKAPA